LPWPTARTVGGETQLRARIWRHARPNPEIRGRRRFLRDDSRAARGEAVERDERRQGRRADGSRGPGPAGGEVKLAEVSATADYPVRVVSIKIALPAETVEWAKTEAGHVYVTNSDNPYRKLSVRG